jgi:hypothetical protein
MSKPPPLDVVVEWRRRTAGALANLFDAAAVVSAAGGRRCPVEEVEQTVAMAQRNGKPCQPRRGPERPLKPAEDPTVPADRDHLELLAI